MHICHVFGDVNMKTGIQLGCLGFAALQRIIFQGIGGMQTKASLNKRRVVLKVFCDKSYVFPDPLVTAFLSVTIRHFISECGAGADPVHRLLNQIQ